MFVIAGIVIATEHFLLKLPDAMAMISGGIALIIVDLMMRLMKKNQGWLTRKTFGGYLFFAPVWVFGIIVIAVNLINFFVNTPARL